MSIRIFCLLLAVLSTVGCSSARFQNEVALGPHGTLRQDGSDGLLMVSNHGPGLVTAHRVHANGEASEELAIAATEGLAISMIKGDVIVVENHSPKFARLSLSAHDRLQLKAITQ